MTKQAFFDKFLHYHSRIIALTTKIRNMNLWGYIFDYVIAINEVLVFLYKGSVSTKFSENVLMSGLLINLKELILGKNSLSLLK